MSIEYLNELFKNSKSKAIINFDKVSIMQDNMQVLEELRLTGVYNNKFLIFASVNNKGVIKAIDTCLDYSCYEGTDFKIDKNSQAYLYSVSLSNLLLKEEKINLMRILQPSIISIISKNPSVLIIPYMSEVNPEEARVFKFTLNESRARVNYEVYSLNGRLLESQNFKIPG